MSDEIRMDFSGQSSFLNDNEMVLFIEVLHSVSYHLNTEGKQLGTLEVLGNEETLGGTICCFVTFIIMEKFH